MEGLDLDNILDDEQIETLFEFPENNEEEETNNDENKDKKEKKESTAEVDPDEMFGEPESVGSEDNKDSKEDTTQQRGGASPEFFSSIASAFAEEGIFPDLDEETIKAIKTPEDFRKAIDAQIKAGLDEQQRRVAEALDSNIDPDSIKMYENTLSMYDSITDEMIESESEKSEKLRKDLIYSDYIQKGFSKARAEREVNRSVKEGTDIEDAKESLNSMKEFARAEYNQLIQAAKEEAKQREQEAVNKVKKLKDSIMEGSFKLFEDVAIDNATKQKAYDAITKPIFKDPKTGRTYTAIQKLEEENGTEFSAKLGLIYALTDGFKSLEKLVGKKVRKEMKKGFSDLERVINNTSRDSSGNLRFISGVSDSDSYIGKGMRLDI